MSTRTTNGARTVRVPLNGGRSYDVLVGAGALAQTRARIDALLGRSVPAFVVHDRGVPVEFCDELRADGGGRVHTFEPCEAHKSLVHLAEILHEMSRARLERTHYVVALGGGITGDITGLAAGVYRRGVPWINCPTTLLAMVDASIGGKTGINLTLEVGGAPVMLKNMVGVFHQPRLVVADVRALNSLPDRELRAGLAECLKHGLLAGPWNDESLFDWTRSNLAAILARDEATLTELVTRNVAVKAGVVAADERESGEGPGGGRMALNLGHTFAHALEAITGLGLSHGEAVGLGLLAAAECSRVMGKADPGLRSELDDLLERAGLPTRVAGLPAADRVIELMLDDKKVDSGSLRLILPVPGRQVEVAARPPLDAVRGAIDSLRA